MDPVCQLSADSTSIVEGQSIVLTWTSANAVQVTLNTEEVALNGSLSVTPTETTQYDLCAIGGEAMMAMSSVTVNVTPRIPTASLWASAHLVPLGTPVKLIWSTTNAESVWLNGDPVAPCGEMDVMPGEGINEFTLEAHGSNSQQAMANLSVEASSPGQDWVTYDPNLYDEYEVVFSHPYLEEDQLQYFSGACNINQPEDMEAAQCEAVVAGTLQHNLPAEYAQYFPLIVPLDQAPRDDQPPAWQEEWADPGPYRPWIIRTVSNPNSPDFQRWRDQWPNLSDVQIIQRLRTPGWPPGFMWNRATVHQPANWNPPAPIVESGLIEQTGNEAQNVMCVWAFARIGTACLGRAIRWFRPGVPASPVPPVGPPPPPARQLIILASESELPAMIPPNTTIIISQRLALMRDTEEILRNIGRVTVRIIRDQPLPP